MPEFREGDLVDVTIKGVPIDDVNADGTVNIIAEHSDGGPATWHMPPQAKVERVAPAEWPPRPGDVWKNQQGVHYWATGAYLECANRLVSQSGSGWNPEEVNRTYGPLTLVHREEATS